MASTVALVDDNGGEALVGDVLSVQYVYSDSEGDAEGVTRFRWLRDGEEIPEAAVTSYTLVRADSGRAITIEVTPVAQAGTTEGAAVLSNAVIVANSPPVVISAIVTVPGDGAVPGASLTASYVYTDADGDAEGDTTFRWLRNGTPIPGATGPVYVLTAADEGQVIRVEIIPVAVSGAKIGAALLSSPVEAAAGAPVAEDVQIVDENGGALVLGDTLNGVYTYTDAEGDLEGATQFRWLRNGAAIAGADDQMYELLIEDIDQDIRFEVTPVALTGVPVGKPALSPAVMPQNAAPVANEVAVRNESRTSGNFIGDLLTGTYVYEDNEGDAEGASSFRWLRDNEPIVGATRRAYRVSVADNGRLLSFEVTPVAGRGTMTGNTVRSAPVRVATVVLNSRPTATGVSITDDNGGSALVGDSLTGNYTYSDVNGDAEGVSTFRWLRDGVPIVGATASTYTLAAADSGQTITFEVTPVAATGTTPGLAVVSVGITVSNSVPTASAVSITDDNGGSAVVGDGLTGNYTYADVDGDAEGASTFRWLRGGAPIAGAMASTYTLVAADSGQTITFEVTPVAATGTTPGLAVVSVGITVSNSVPTASAVSITDDNGGSAVVGDSLTGNYSYADVDGDAEGTSTFRWLRGGAPIAGAMASTYTLVTADSGQTITFEVTPVAATGATTGSAVASGGLSIINSVPTASTVSITDDNGGSAVLGDGLTGNYTYGDVDGDAEGVSTFRWLRDGAPITGATASTYTLVAADVPARITFEVTPVAATGATAGLSVTSAALGTGTAPVVSGLALFRDVNFNGAADAGDELILPFDQAVSVGGAGNEADLSAPVAGDSLGAGATLAAGPAANQITVTLGAGAGLKSRQTFDPGVLIANAASGLDVSAANADIIESTSGVDAVASTAIDILPAFVDSGQALGMWRASHAVLGDLDGDGDLDLILANNSFRQNQVYINDGTGVFTETPQLLGLNDTRGIALGDIDNDGDLDVVGVNPGSNRVYKNDGNGLFTDDFQSLGFRLSESVELADVDRDGDLDMLVTNELGQPNRIWTNDGTGTFTDSGQIIGLNDSAGLAVGDVDGDGDVDMAVGNVSGEPNRIYLNDGAGLFTDSGQTLGTGNSQSVVLGDLDGDGDLDLVSGNEGEPNRVFTNDGTGTFTDSGQALGSGDTYRVRLGDIDADGDLDLIEANFSNEANLVYLNDGTGTFSDSGQTLGSNESRGIALGDVDGDGDLDWVSANESQASRVYLNSLSGTWGSATYVDSGQTPGAQDARSVALGDVDRDGDLDLVVANDGQGNQVFTNNGAGSFTDSGQSLGSDDSGSVILGDVDGDGDLDMVVANRGVVSNRVYTNNGAGSFTDSGQTLGTNNSFSVALGDVDGDGDLDVAVANDAGQANRIYTNDGSGTFADSGQALGSSDSRGIALGDIDGDGDLDMVVANDTGQGNRVYTNNGSGSFSDSGQVLGSSDSFGVTLGDVDGDGDLDIVVANSGANRVYTNDGSGTFADSGQALGSTFSDAVVLDDVDGDGDLDIVVANSLENRVYTNNGSGSFIDSGQALGIIGSADVALGDVDGDGDLDLVVANFFLVGNQLFLNQ